MEERVLDSTSTLTVQTLKERGEERERMRSGDGGFDSSDLSGTDNLERTRKERAAKIASRTHVTFKLKATNRSNTIEINIK